MAERFMGRRMAIVVAGPEGKHCALTCPHDDYCAKTGDEWDWDAAECEYRRTASCMAEATELTPAEEREARGE